jgi:hypothetical protein
MSSKERGEYDNLIYLKPGHQMADLIDHSMEKILSRLARINTAGTETNIPLQGRLIIAFLPHQGFLEPILIDQVLEKVGRRPAVWVTKKESRDLPGVMQSGRRLIYVDREHPKQGSVRAVREVLGTPNGIIASALEGTRYSNPDITDDVLSLGETLPGLMRFSYDSDSPDRPPVVGAVVLGVDRILPSLDAVVKENGIMEALRFIANGLISPVDVDIRFLPPYRDHLGEQGKGLRGKERTDFIEKHKNILTGLMVDEILSLDPGYPLGFYR